MTALPFLLRFLLEGQHYALPLSAVDRVVRVVEITPLPKAPDIVLGVVNVQGRVIAVINLRRRFRLPEREISLTDEVVIAHTARRPVALVVDAVEAVDEYSERDVVESASVLPAIEYVQGIAKLAGGLTLIHDLDRFLSLDEEAALDRALASE